MKKLTLNIIFNLLILNSIYSQGFDNIWYFGNRAGINFTGGSPTAITNSGMVSLEGCATISSRKGDLLFYTNGIKVFNSNHSLMPNGDSLAGHPSSTHSAIIVSMSGTNNRYYIFTVDAAENTLAKGLRYSIVDMTLNGGLGDVTHIKNKLLYKPVPEKITAIEHANKKDIWLITHEWGSNVFRSYLITSSGIDSIPVISSVGPYHWGNLANAIGYLKVSHDGTRLALASYINNRVELYKFDQATGKVSSPVIITFSSREYMYGIEFSPDGKKIYLTNTDSKPGKIYQFDISNHNSVDIEASRVLIGKSDKTSTGALQLGADGKIYISQIDGQYLGVINDPDTLGQGCNYSDKGVYLSGKICKYGLPTFIPTEFAIPEIHYSNICVGNATSFYLSETTDIDSVYWVFDDEDTGPLNYSSSINATHVFSSTGVYYVEVTIYYQGKSAKIKTTIIIADRPYMSLGGDRYLCDNQSIVISPGDNFFSYLWHDRSSKSYVIVDKPGKYWLTVSDGTCTASDTLNIMECSELWMPNAFTPDGDGINDIFYVKGVNINQIEMYIYNIWGELIFESNEINKGWDGTYKGKACKQGVYIYMIKLKAEGILSNGGIRSIHKGSVLLLRRS